jgi:flagellum-specific ATP synthase
VLEAIGLRLSVGAECTIELPPGSTLPYAQAEVVGFSGERLFLMPTTDVAGVLPGARVWPLEAAPVADPLAGAKRLPVGWEMLGRVVDASGRPLDGLGPLAAKVDAPLSAPSINPLDREPIITCSTSACARSTACSPSAAASAWACSPAPASASRCCSA